MADIGEIDLIAGQKAFNQLDKLITKTEEADKKMLALADSALQVNKNLSSITTPKGLNDLVAGNQELLKQYKTLLTETEALKKKVAELNTARQTARKGITQERVDTQILNTERRRELTLTSNLAGEYRKLSAQVAIASEKYQNLIARGRLAGQTHKQFNKELQAAQREFRTLQNRVLEADKAVDKWSRTGQRSVGILKNLVGAFGITTGIQLLVNTTKEIFEQVKTIQSLDLALKSVTKTQENFYAQQVFLNGIAKKHGLEINSLTKQYTAFYVAAKDKLAGSEIQQVFEDISRSGSALGLSNDDLARSFTAVNQMLSKGTVASEELRGQLAEAMPGAVQAMTRAVQKLHPEIKNLTEKGLFEMIKAGKILASDVLPETAKQLAIITGADNAEKMDTLTKSTNRFSNAWIKLVRSINEADSSGFAKFVKSIVDGLTNIMDFTGLLFKNEKQLQNYFKNLGAEQGLEQYRAIIANISGTTKEQQEITKKALIERERETIKTNLAIIASEKKKRESIIGGDRALFHLQTKQEENALVQVGKSAAILKALSEERIKENKKVAASVIELTDEQKRAEEERLKAIYEANKKEVELRLLKSDTILNGDLTSYSDQYKALQNSESLKLMLLKLAYDEQVRLAKGNANKIKSADLDFQMAIIKQTQDTGAKLKSIRQKQNEEYIQEIKDIEKFLKDHEDEKVRIAEIYDDQELEQFMIAWKAREGAYNKEIERLKELKQATKEYLQSFTEEFASNSGFGETFNTFFKQIEDADGKMTTMFEQLWEGADTSAEKFSVAFTAIAESAQEAFNFISEASRQNFEQEYERLENQSKIAKEFAGDNAAAQEEIDRQVEAKKKEIAIREAKAKKKLAIMNIQIDTAQAIVAAWAKPGYPGAIPLTIAIGALGLAQSAAVNAQQIPQYWKGTDNHPGGLMMINDGKGSDFKETAVTPDGKILQSDKRNVIMDAPKGTKVFTNAQWKNEIDNNRWKKELDNMIFSNGINWNQVNNPNSSSSGINKNDLNALGSGIVNGITNAINHKKEFSFSIDRKGFNASIIDGNTRRTILNNEINSTGIKV